jgi:hypothetical protein
MSIHSPDKEDRHSLPIERTDVRRNCGTLCYRKLSVQKPKNDFSRSPKPPDSLSPPTTTQAGGEKSIEHYRLEAATLAREGQHIFMAAIFAFHMGKAVVQISYAPNIQRLRNRR